MIPMLYQYHVACSVPLCYYQALLTKHNAIMSDLKAYVTVIDGLREQSSDCKVRRSLVTLKASNYYQ